jgi:chorismate mutase
MSETELTDLRAEIDAIDIELLQLLVRRNSVSDRVKLVKTDAGVKLRPGREAEILRRLLARNAGRYPARTLLRIWREIFSASLANQGAFSTAVLTQDGGHILWDLARDHLGSGGAFNRYATPRRVLEAVAGGEDTLGVLPAPDPQDADPWWQHLLVHPNLANNIKTPKIIARLPIAKAGNMAGNMAGNRAGDIAEEAVIIALMEPDASADDRAYLAIDLANDVSADRLSEALDGVGIDGVLAARWHEAAAPERWVNLVHIGGYSGIGDARFQALADRLGGQINQIIWLGSYAEQLNLAEIGGR